MYFNSPSESFCLMPSNNTSTLNSHPWAFLTFSQTSLGSYSNMLQYFNATMSTLLSLRRISWVSGAKLLLLLSGKSSLGFGAWISWLWRYCWLASCMSRILRIPNWMYSILLRVLGISELALNFLARVPRLSRYGSSILLAWVRFCRDSVMKLSINFSSILQIFSALSTFSAITVTILSRSFFQSAGSFLRNSLLRAAKSFRTLCLRPELHFSQKILHLSASDRISWMDCLRLIKKSVLAAGSVSSRNWLILVKSSSPFLILETLSCSAALSMMVLRSAGDTSLCDWHEALFLRICCSMRCQRCENITALLQLVNKTSMAYQGDPRTLLAFATLATNEDESIKLIKLYADRILQDIEADKRFKREMEQQRVREEESNKAQTNHFITVYETSMIDEEDEANPESDRTQYPERPFNLMNEHKRIKQYRRVTNPFVSSAEFARIRGAAKRASFVHRQVTIKAKQQKTMVRQRSRSPAEKQRMLDSFMRRLDRDIVRRKANSIERAIQKTLMDTYNEEVIKSSQPDRSRTPPPLSKHQKELWDLRKKKRLQQQEKCLGFRIGPVNKEQLLEKIVKQIVIPGSELIQALHQ